MSGRDVLNHLLPQIILDSAITVQAVLCQEGAFASSTQKYIEMLAQLLKIVTRSEVEDQMFLLLAYRPSINFFPS